MANHTSGPWLIDNSTDSVNGHDLDAISVVQKNGEQWCVAAVWTDLPDIKEASANARLIAEAPVLKDYLSSARVVLARMRRSMMAHPDHEVGSEFDDLTTESQILEDEIVELIKKIEG